MLYFADIKTFRKKLNSEMAEVLLMDNLPVQSDQWTYPEIQPKLIHNNHGKFKQPVLNLLVKSDFHETSSNGSICAARW